MDNRLEQKVSELTNDEPSRQKSSMRPENQSSVSQFLLLGLPIPPGQQGLFFTLFLGMYLTTVLGNLLIILLIRLDSRLHTPMYVAICHPLHYIIIMREGLCVLLVAGSWILSCGQSLLQTLLLVRLSFCVDNTITHFFCDLAALLKLSCSDTSLNELVIFTAGGILFFLPFGVILGSYIRIGTIILRVPSTKRLYKAFSTCGSHLSVVSLYYGTAAGVYFFSSSWDSKDIIASVIYTVVTPMLNPFIYSLRNRDIKQALEMCVNRVKFFKQQSLNPPVAFMLFTRNALHEVSCNRLSPGCRQQFSASTSFPLATRRSERLPPAENWCWRKTAASSHAIGHHQRLPTAPWVLPQRWPNGQWEERESGY
ncbi:LOW QUALITY PROTEIN: hypothetical protein QTO34_005199, partial [Cnephaeus nilssonii]